jgi:galactose oxidase-like protein
MSEHWLWTQKEDIGPSPRFGTAMAYEAVRQRVVLFGGTPLAGGRLNDTWEWDGVAWTQVADMGVGRSFAGMTYDDARQRLVLFGGYVRGVVEINELNDDTWEWNGTEWTQVADIGPARRVGCAFAYDTVRQRAVLFGGFGGSSGNEFLGDTWEWDGTEWTQIADTGPPPRSYLAMVFDSSRECLVLFGGNNLGWLNDTWEWTDDGGWVKRQDMGPQFITSPTMVYSEKHTVLFGAPGQGERGAGHTWEWDGNRWTQRQNMGPPARVWHALAYDSQRDRVVLFGGRATRPQQNPPDIAFGDTWELAIIEQ